MEELFNIENFNIISDEENYYFFRALNRADSKDVQDGVILDEDGKYLRIRTDRERYEEDSENGTAKYKSEDEISLEQAYDHIKMHYRKDTNCISLSSNANVLLDYGRRNYNDEYVMIKVPKREIGQRVKLAGKYMLEEIEKRIDEYIFSMNESEERQKEILEKIQQIEKATDVLQIKEIIRTTFKSAKLINKSKSMLKPGIRYRAPHSRISNYQALNEEQNLFKNKIIAKLTLLERKAGMESLIPYVSNNNVVQSVGNAFSSMEQVHYGDIAGKQIQNVTSIVMDMFALLQQIEDKSIANVEEIKRDLIDFVNSGRQFEIPKNSILSMNSEVKDNITIEEMYELTDGKVEFGMANSIVRNMFYLAKSQVRAREVAEFLNQITGSNPKYKQAIEYIVNNGFRIEPEAITRQSNRGYRLSESVSLDLKTNEIPLVEAIKNLSAEEQIEILEKGGLSNTGNIITDTFSRLQRDEKISREEYYAGAIIDSYDWSKIGVEEFTIEQRNDFIKKLQEKNCVEIYKKLKEAGIEEKDIPLYAINIASKKQFSNILTSDNYIELIQQNKEDLSQELSIPQIETFLDYNKIDGTNIVLRDHQRLAIERIDEKFESKRYIAVVLPTGSGKSFPTLVELLEHKDESILYLAPNNLILEQMKDYIIEYVHGKQGTIGKTKDEIVAEVFPNIKFETYGGLLAQRDQEVIKDKYDFIVLDELHRTGAKEWEGKLDELLENQEESTKVLGITATPIRDMDDRNMADEMALKLGYNKEEVKRREHIVMDMDLINAIKLGIVVNPKVFWPEYITEIDGNLLEKIDSIQDEILRKEKLADYERLRKNVDSAKGIPEILEENIKQGEKYIVFIPITDKNETIEDEEGNIIGKKTGKDKIQEYEQKLREYLKDLSIIPKFYSMLGAYSNQENKRQLNEFEIDDPQSVKLMIVMNKANEGLHINGVNGIIWFRPLDENSRILYLQQLGRAIYAEDPNNPTPDDKRPKIIDLVGNTLNVNMDRYINKNSRRDDYELLCIVVDWVQNNGLPNIDSNNKTEQRYAATLYRIQNKYMKYTKGFEQFLNLDEDKKEDVRAILEKGTEIDLWDIELPPKTMTQINKMLNIDSFEITGLMRDFVAMYNEVDGYNKWYSLEEKIEYLISRGNVESIRKREKDERGNPIGQWKQDIKDAYKDGKLNETQQRRLETLYYLKQKPYYSICLEII